MKIIRKNNGTILILTLWALGTLAVFALNLGVMARSKITLVKRLERRSELLTLATSGVEKGMAVFFDEPEEGDLPMTAAQNRIRTANNPEDFENVQFGAGSFDLRYTDYDNTHQSTRVLYGFIDEERKININNAGVDVLKRLFEAVLSWDKFRAEELAKAVIAWRQYGENEIVGFYSNEYYENLEFSYQEKKGRFENINELWLVKGFDEKTFKILEPYLTVYGNGQVNLNTAPKPVLKALGLSDGLSREVLAVRNGPDGIALTEDDVIFDSPDSLWAALNSFGGISEKEANEIAQSAAQGLLGVGSSYYRITSTGRLTNSKEERTIDCIFDGNSGQIVYWRE